MSHRHDDSADASTSPFADAFSERLAAGLGLGARLARRARRMTRAEVAERLGITTEFYARIERGQALPSVTTLARLMEALALDLDAIIQRAAGGELPGAGAPSDPLPVRRVLRRLRRAPERALSLVLALLEALGVKE